MMRAAAMMCVLVLAAACAAAPGTTPAEPANPALHSAGDDSCGSSMFGELIGKPIDGPGVPGESRLNRHILPGTQVTMDYVAQRTNIHATQAGIIEKITCG